MRLASREILRENALMVTTTEDPCIGEMAHALETQFEELFWLEDVE
jgi:hypothetical protein